MQVDWELSQSFVSDGQGVRDVGCIPSTSSSADSFSLVAGNQGGGLTCFGVPTGDLQIIPYQHNHAVTAVLSTAELSAMPAASFSFQYVTACKDGVLRLFDAQHKLVGELKGHEKPVTSLAWACNNDSWFLVSGSWDGTAKIWNVANHSVIATLPDHENSVCVTSLPPADSNDEQSLRIATGSAGIAQNNVIQHHTIRIWNVQPKTGQATLEHSVVQDHEGPIRGLCRLQPQGSPAELLQFASCSNDGTVKLRDATGQAVLTLSSFLTQQQQEHPSMLLSVTVLQDDSKTIVASGEDGNVIVWNVDMSNNGETSPPQVLLHPSCVWNVVALPNGDFATCCQDGKVYIFTRSSDRMADSNVREEFAAEARKAHEKQSSGPSQEEIAKLPEWHTQQHVLRGRSEGQVQLFQKDGSAIAAQWSASSQCWIEVGQVMGSANKNTVDGVEYDHVFPIQVDAAEAPGGVANLQIGYNNGENPFVAAQRFIDAHVLPQYHLSEIADYIQQRVGRTPTVLGGDSGPAGAASSATPASFAGTGLPIAAFEHIPAKSYKKFELPAKSAETTMSKMKTKIESFDTKLSDDQWVALSSLMSAIVQASTAAGSKSGAKKENLQVLLFMLQKFPLSERFPALDLARLAVLLDPAGSTDQEFGNLWKEIVDQAFQSLSGDSGALEGNAAVAFPMLSLRLFANALSMDGVVREVVASRLDDVLTVTAQHIKSPNKNVRLSVATALYNVSLYCANAKVTTVTDRLLGLILEVLSNYRSYESEATYRTLVSLGTMVLSDSKAKEMANTLFLASRVEPAASPHGTEVKKAAKEVYAVLQ